MLVLLGASNCILFVSGENSLTFKTHMHVYIVQLLYGVPIWQSPMFWRYCFICMVIPDGLWNIKCKYQGVTYDSDIRGLLTVVSSLRCRSIYVVLITIGGDTGGYGKTTGGWNNVSYYSKLCNK